jgi:hypothetical protein
MKGRNPAHHKIVPVDLLNKYVKCHVTDREQPKFVKKRSAIAAYNVLEFNEKPAPKLQSDHLENMNNAILTRKDQQIIRDAIENHDITTDKLLMCLDNVENLQDDCTELREKMEQEYKRY